MSTEEDKNRILSHDERSDCALWSIRVVARIDAEGYYAAIDSSKRSTAGENGERQVKNIVVNDLSDQSVRFVR